MLSASFHPEVRKQRGVKKKKEKRKSSQSYLPLGFYVGIDGKGVLIAKDRTVNTRKNIFSVQQQGNGSLGICNLETSQVRTSVGDVLVSSFPLVFERRKRRRLPCHLQQDERAAVGRVAHQRARRPARTRHHHWLQRQHVVGRQWRRSSV